MNSNKKECTNPEDRWFKDVKQLDIASCIWPEAKPLENFKQLKIAKNITYDFLNILF